MAHGRTERLHRERTSFPLTRRFGLVGGDDPFSMRYTVTPVPTIINSTAYHPISGRLLPVVRTLEKRMQFLDALAPIAAKQIVSALNGGSRHWQYLARSRMTEDGLDYLLKAIIRKPCAVRIEVCRSFDAPPPSVEVVDQSHADAGFFERRIDARYRTHGHMVLMTLNDDEYCLHRMHDE